MSSFDSAEIKHAVSSQELPLSDRFSPTSPLGLPTCRLDGSKERRNPSITPKRFSRFFTPISQGSTHLSSARQALHDITNNRNGPPSSPLKFKSISGQENSLEEPGRGLKRRRLLHTPGSSPPGHIYAETKDQGIFKVLQYGGGGDQPREDDLQNIQSSPCERAAQMEDIEEERNFREPVKRIVPIDGRGLGGRLLQSISAAPPRSRRQHLAYPVTDWQNETASFYSKPTDVHMCNGITSPHRVIPFCAVSCNTNSLVAIGDEEGQVRLLESAKDERPPFTDVYHAFRPHTNAIIDMVFSRDDSLLATASGDQSARVVDMTTQTTLSILHNHSASLKQVRFQPGSNSNSVIATSSRDGSVQIWDLRCKGSSGPRQRLVGAQPTGPVTRSGARNLTYGRAVNSIYNAHRQFDFDRNLVHSQGIPGNDLPGRGEVPGRIGDISVTALSFLPEGQEHFLLTASEGDASVKLWDLRSLHTKTNGKLQMPISRTRQPQSHSQWRHFGVNSLNVSSDGSRFYTLCKDNTVYAYSTSHLILGHAPELALDNPGRRLPPQSTKEGLGPMYGFRHPQLHATSFYVKSALRMARDGQSEILAVGSSDGCAILFPTDERYFPKHQRQPIEDTKIIGPSISGQRPGLRRTGSGIGLASRVEDSIPMSTNGTPLIRGHDREVGSLAWTHDGGLVTVGDDFLIRCWREGEDARDLRTGGETGGRRWGCGWADVSGKYDEDDD